MQPVEEERHQIDAVGSHDDRYSALAIQLCQEFHHPLFAHRIESGGRLVKEQDAMSHCQKTGNADPLLLAVAKVMDILSGKSSHLNLFEGHSHFFSNHGLVKPHVSRSEGDILEYRAGKELVIGILED